MRNTFLIAAILKWLLIAFVWPFYGFTLWTLALSIGDGSWGWVAWNLAIALAWSRWAVHWTDRTLYGPQGQRHARAQAKAKERAAVELQEVIGDENYAAYREDGFFTFTSRLGHTFVLADPNRFFVSAFRHEGDGTSSWTTYCVSVAYRPDRNGFVPWDMPEDDHTLILYLWMRYRPWEFINEAVPASLLGAKIRPLLDSFRRDHVLAADPPIQ